MASLSWDRIAINKHIHMCRRPAFETGTDFRLWNQPLQYILIIITTVNSLVFESVLSRLDSSIKSIQNSSVPQILLILTLCVEFVPV